MASNANPPITRDLAQFAATLNYDAIPSDVVNRIRQDALDSIAVGIFGSSRPWITLATELWEELGGAPQATVWGRRSKLSVPVAVRANSHAQNAFEYDDTYVWRGIATHQGNNVVPAAVATAEYVGGVSGRDFLAALVAGHEVGIRVRLGITATRHGPNHTAICSTFGAAAAAGRLLRLTPQQMMWALGSAGAYVGGILTYPPSSMVKRLVNGRAAEGGAIGAMLAARGFTGIENVLEADRGGFYTTYTDGFDLGAVVNGLSDTFYSVHIQPKRYPMITTAGHAIEAACRLVAATAHPIRAADVEEVIVRTNARSQLMTTGFVPNTISSAQMSMAFGVATALRHGHVRPEAVNEAALEDPEIQTLMRKFRPIAEPEFDAIKKEAGGPAQVTVRLRDGRELKSPVVPEISRMTEAEIEDKARHAIDLVFGPRRADEIVAVFRDIDRRDTIDPLFPLLSAG